jgi:hypothetical protein
LNHQALQIKRRGLISNHALAKELVRDYLVKPGQAFMKANFAGLISAKTETIDHHRQIIEWAVLLKK